MTAPDWPDPSRPGVPANPERDGWHWLLWSGMFPGDKGEESPRAYRWERDGWWDGSIHRTARYWTNGWRYLGPCLTPAEVAAAEVAAERRGMERAAEIVREQARDARGMGQHGRADVYDHATAAIRAAAQKEAGE